MTLTGPGRVIALSTLFAAALSMSGWAGEPPLENGGGWELVWQDEFDGDTLDRTKWSFDVDCWGGGNEERQCYTARPENLQVRDGVLSIIARRETAAGPALPARMRNTEAEKSAMKAQPFTSARINTSGKADWLYGRFEARARPPQGQGTWPAIWMLPTEDYYGGWAASGEIDIMETVNLGATCKECESGRKDLVYGTIHHGGEWPRNVYTGDKTTLPPSEDGFYVFATEWEEGVIRWYVDDVHYLTLTSDDWRAKALFSNKPKHAPFDRPFYMILNLAIGGHLAENNNDGGVSMEGYPKTFDIDYVRVYQKAEHRAADAALRAESDAG